jgi:nucleotide-binding universal stress UspA family protein
MKVERILALTDLSPASRAGLTMADALAERTGGHVDIGYVSLPIPGKPPAGQEAIVRRVAALIADEENEALQEVAAGCVAPERRGLVRRLETDCIRCGIRDLVVDERPDLVCLSVRGRGRDPDLLVGSHAEFTARASGVPVLLARAERLPRPGHALKVLLAADLVESPTVAARRIRWLVDAGDELALAHVVPGQVFYPPALGVSDAFTPGEHAELRRRAEAALSDTDLGAEAPRIAVHVREGHPGEVLTELARELDPHLLVVRTHATRTFDPMMLGPVCEYVIRRSPVSVLVLPKEH